jgi:3-oxoacyl-[acyl-carrier protein] reductase
VLEGKIVYITGSTRGIGWATARQCAGNGATVLLNGHADEEQLQVRVKELTAEFHVQTDGFFCDVSDYDETAGVYQQIFKKYKRLDVLVNNAGILQDAVLGMISSDNVERTFGVNLAGALFNLQSAARLMSRASIGSIINLSSIVGVEGNVGQAVYASSKAGIIGLTKSAAKELAPQGIRVNAVAPGFIDTDMARQIPDEIFRKRVESVAMGRIGTPEDVASVIVFLASDASSYVTGQVIGVDGGMVL